MKTAFVVSTQPTRFQAVAFAPDLEANIARIAALGYDGIELAVRQPSLLDLAGLKRMLNQHHLAVPAIGSGQAYVEERLSFTDSNPTVRERALARIKTHIALAHEFDALVIVGLMRGKLEPDVDAAQAHEWLVSALKAVAEDARALNTRVAIEPLNRYETNLLSTVAETSALIDEVQTDNLGILFDTFHSNIEEPHLDESLRACGARLYHVHLADSNRWAPGAGHLDFHLVFETLRAMGYQGWVSAEILPKPDIPQAAEQALRTVRSLLDSGSTR